MTVSTMCLPQRPRVTDRMLSTGWIACLLCGFGHDSRLPDACCGRIDVMVPEARCYCNTICPVGTILGCLSKLSLLRPVIDTSKCNGCRSCERNCKASCIDASSHSVDYSRCVACMDCIDNCRQGAISYTFCNFKRDVAEVTQPPVDNNEAHVSDGRSGDRHAAAANAAVGKLHDGGLAYRAESRTDPQRAYRAARSCKRGQSPTPVYGPPSLYIQLSQRGVASLYGFGVASSA